MSDPLQEMIDMDNRDYREERLEERARERLLIIRDAAWINIVVVIDLMIIYNKEFSGSNFALLAILVIVAIGASMIAIDRKG